MSVLRRGLRYCWNKLKDAYYFIPSIKGYKHLKHIQDERPNSAIFITSYALGDLVYALACIEVWHKMNPEKKIVLIADPNKKEIIESYSSFDEVLYYGRNTKLGKQILVHLNGSWFYSFVGRNRGIYNTIPEQIYGRKLGRNNLDLLKDYLQLPNNSEIVYPKPQKVEITSIPNFGKSKDKIVVINPYSSGNTICRCTELLNKIVDVLKDKGFIVYSNIVGEQEPLNGTDPLRCDLLEMYSIADEIPLVVSVRSGIVDWIVSTNSKKFVIYRGNSSDGFSKMFNLKAWGIENCKEVYMENLSNQDALDILEKYIGD